VNCCAISAAEVMSHTEYQDLLTAYALDAIDPDDGEALGQHLATCEQCRDELNMLRETGALLAHASPAAAPGNHVRAEILARARAEGAPRQPAQVVQMPPRANTVWPNLLRLAAAIAFVALLAGVIVLWRREARLQTQMRELSRQLEAQQGEMQRTRDLMVRQKEALALLNSDAATKIQLIGSQSAPNARATLMFDKQTGRAVLLTEGLPMTSAEKAYEVWFIPKGHAPMPGKVFTVDPSGHAMITDQMPAEAMNGAVIAVTVEPRSGSASPTGAIYLASPAS
jgi:anti-sigma-K factor RskA